MSSHVYHFHTLNFGIRSFLSTLSFRSVCSTTLLPCHDCLCSDHIDFLSYHLVCFLACISNPPFQLTGTDINTGTFFLLSFLLSWIINTNMGPRDATKQSSIFRVRAELRHIHHQGGQSFFRQTFFLAGYRLLTVSLGMAVDDPVSP